MTGQPLIAIAKEEGEQLAAALIEVAKHYPVVMMSDKAAALLALGWTATVIYGPRVMVYSGQRQQQRQADQQPIMPTDAPSSDADVMGQQSTIVDNEARVRAGIAPDVNAPRPNHNASQSLRGAQTIQPHVVGRRPYDFSRAA